MSDDTRYRDENPGSGERRSRGLRPAAGEPPAMDAEFARAENEDDDGYDPWSDRRPEPDPLFEPDPWD